MAVWKIAPGEGAENWDLFRQEGCIGLGWLELHDYGRFKGVVEVLAALEDAYGEGSKGNGAGAAKMIWRFVGEVEVHDIIVAHEGYNRVVGIGRVTSKYMAPTHKQNPLRNDTTTHRHHVRLVDWFVTDPVDLPGDRFFVQSALWPLDAERAHRIRQAYLAISPHLQAALDQLLNGYQAAVGGCLPEEVAESAVLLEGAVSQVTVNAYERNPEARRQCIEAHGTTCCICGFNFGSTYGPVAEGYIHVHHLRPLSEAGGEYVVNPVDDLRPVCPNCHAVLHLGGECRSIEEVQELLHEQSQAE